MKNTGLWVFYSHSDPAANFSCIQATYKDISAVFAWQATL